jgi:hypothetical protein
MRGFLFWTMALAVLLTGCGIGGVWLDPSNAPSRPPDPFLNHWIKEGITKESRRGDSWACGAAPTVFAAEYARPPEEQLNGKVGKKWHDALEQFSKQWISCMKSKGYVYLENCDARCLYP